MYVDLVYKTIHVYNDTGSQTLMSNAKYPECNQQ